MEISKIYHEIKSQAEKIVGGHFLVDQELVSQDQYKSFVLGEIQKKAEIYHSRLELEFFGLGPIQNLLDDDEITEILINGPQSIWFERSGKLYQHDDFFFSDISFENSIERLMAATGKHLSLNQPFLEGHIPQARVSIVEKSVTQQKTLVSIRKHPKIPWTLEKLGSEKWCTNEESLLIQNIISSGGNFLIIGETGSGKTSVANACLQKLSPNERVVIIEDSSELHTPNLASTKLLTRDDPYKHLDNIDQQELLRRSLRLRPDRLVMGEIRNKEAKDFLMMLATGHKGCFATLHAHNAHEALLRLEMLIQLGAPQWGLQAIRRLIFLSLQYIVVTGRSPQGSRRLQGIYRLSSLEESGLTLDSVVASSALATTSSEWV